MFECISDRVDFRGNCAAAGAEGGLGVARSGFPVPAQRQDAHLARLKSVGNLCVRFSKLFSYQSANTKENATAAFSIANINGITSEIPQLHAIVGLALLIILIFCVFLSGLSKT